MNTAGPFKQHDNPWSDAEGRRKRKKKQKKKKKAKTILTIQNALQETQNTLALLKNKIGMFNQTL